MRIGEMRGVRWAVLSVAAALAGCFQADGPSAGGTGSGGIAVSGVAAVGAPLSGATVHLACGSGASYSATTGADGSWTLTIPADRFPCAIAVDGGTANGAANTLTLHSIVNGSASSITVNITPLTDLALALAVRSATGHTLADWYAGADPATYAAVVAAVDAARTQLQNLFVAGGYTLPSGFDPFSISFTAGNGDPYDDLIEALKAALAAASTSYDALLASFSSAEGTPALPSAPGGGDGGGGDGGDGGGTVGDNPLGDNNGIAFGLGNHVWKLSNAEAVIGFGVVPDGYRRVRASNFNTATNSIIDSATFDGDPVVDATVTVQKVAPGTQACDSNIQIVIQTMIPNTITTAERQWVSTACAIKLDYISNIGGATGTIVSATLFNSHKNKSVTLTGGQFRMYHHHGVAGDMPAQLPDGIFNLLQPTGDGTFELPPDQYFAMDNNPAPPSSGFNYGVSPDDGTPPFNGNASDRIVWGIQNASFNGPGSYDCAPNNKLSMFVEVGQYSNELVYESDNINSDNDGSCTVTITKQSGRLYAAHYTATLVGIDGTPALLSTAQRTLHLAGRFRNFIIVPIAAGNQGNEGNLPDTGAATTLHIDDGNTVFTKGQQFVLGASSGAVPATGAYSLVFQRTLPFNTAPNDKIRKSVSVNLTQVPHGTGTFNCGDTGSFFAIAVRTAQGIDYGYASNVAGTSCSVTIDSFDAQTVTGHYSAVLRNADAEAFLPGGDATITVSGQFRQAVQQQ